MAFSLMTAVAVFCGNLIFKYINRKVIEGIFGGIFLIFGIVMLWECKNSKQNSSSLTSENEDLNIKTDFSNDSAKVPEADLEKLASSNLVKQPNTNRSKWFLRARAVGICFWTVCALEIGDKSQISTMSLANNTNNLAVILGSICGYLVDTMLSIGLFRIAIMYINKRIIDGTLGAVFIGIAIYKFVQVFLVHD